jgi:hypothetical protein
MTLPLRAIVLAACLGIGACSYYGEAPATQPQPAVVYPSGTTVYPPGSVAYPPGTTVVTPARPSTGY